MSDTTLRAFSEPDEIREFPFGRFELAHLAEVTLGGVTYQPGWMWSVHNAPSVGTRLCHAPHTGVVLSGHGVVAYEDGKAVDLLPGAGFPYFIYATRQLGRWRPALCFIACLEGACAMSGKFAKDSLWLPLLRQLNEQLLTKLGLFDLRRRHIAIH